MYGVTPIHRGWQLALNDLVSAARQHLVIAVPFITGHGAHSITAMLDINLREQGRVDIITDLSPSHVCDGVLEPAAIQHMMAATTNAALWHVPRLHAKVYLADHIRAIVTSGNLTAGAFYRNVEYGFDIIDSELVSSIDSDLMDIKFLGVVVGSQQLAEYVEVADKVRESFQRQQNTVDPALKRAFTNAIQIAEDDLIRLRLAGGAVHTVFAKTILFLLRKHGPLKTSNIHQLIQQLHPDLCDDSVDRVIDGKCFGKKWKHAVRTAQQQNKRLGLINNEGELWHVTG
jgi:phosphatidylserine/phosphatidylglycerophosphate/cardiolipin synthase-like enzyme